MVAVKYLKEEKAETSDLEERILLRVSNHRHIVTFVGHSEDNLGKKFLAFELMTRGTLSHNLSERRTHLGEKTHNCSPDWSCYSETACVLKASFISW